MDDAKFLVGAKKYSCVAKGWNRNRKDTNLTVPRKNKHRGSLNDHRPRRLPR